MKISKDDNKKAMEDLKSGYIGLKEKQDVYTLMRHIAPSGMTRYIDVYIVGKDGTIWRITWSVAAAIGYTYDEKNEAIKVGGAGFDAGHDIVYNLSLKLFGDGYKLNHRRL